MSAKLSALKLSDNSVKPTISENIIVSLARLFSTLTGLSDLTIGSQTCGGTKRVSLLMTETMVFRRPAACRARAS